MALVNNQECPNNFALVFIAKKGKKIDLVVPLLIEFSYTLILNQCRVVEIDSLNFILFWEMQAYEQPPSIQPSQVPANTPFKIRVLCNHAGEKRNLMERIQSIKQYLLSKISCSHANLGEPNSFANMKTHSWLWHYATAIPKIIQTKPAGGEKFSPVSNQNQNLDLNDE